jgi:hypothetical protein
MVLVAILIVEKALRGFRPLSEEAHVAICVQYLCDRTPIMNFFEPPIFRLTVIILS